MNHLSFNGGEEDGHEVSSAGDAGSLRRLRSQVVVSHRRHVPEYGEHQPDGEVNHHRAHHQPAPTEVYLGTTRAGHHSLRLRFAS